MFQVASQIAERSTRRESMADLQSKSAAAARLALQGDGWSFTDREECAAHLTAKILDTLPTVRRTGTAREVLTYITTVQGAPAAAAPSIRRMLVPGAAWTPDTVPAHLATFSRLAMEAANWRRGVEAARRRDSAEADRREAAAPVPMDAPHVEADTLDGLWERDATEAAHATARRMLADLGLARLGRAYPAALEAALTSHGWTPAEAAAAMGTNPDTLRQWRGRAVKRIPSATTHTLAAHAHALAYPDTSLEHPHVAPLASDWRETPSEAAPVTVRRTGTPADVLAWIDSATADAPAWTRGLRPATVRRYEAAASAKRARAEAWQADTRASRRAAAGYPATVR